MSGLVYIIELWYFMTTVYSEYEFVLIGYILGVSFVLWSLGSSSLGGLLIIYPFVGYLLLMSSKMNLNGNMLNEIKKVLVVRIILMGNMLILICSFWLIKGFVGFLVMGNYVAFFLIGRYIMVFGLVLYVFGKWYKLLIWGVIPLLFFFLKININLLMVAIALIGVIIV